jgi:hypothetical protein
MTEIKSVEDVVREFERLVLTSYEKGGFILRGGDIETFSQRDWLRTAITALLKHVQEEIAAGKDLEWDESKMLPKDSMQHYYLGKIKGKNAAKDKDIAILQAKIDNH